MGKQFKKFLLSHFSLEIWSGKKIVFHSKEDGVKGLLKFIRQNNKHFRDFIVFDTKAGNAVALLCAYLKIKTIYSAVGSKIAKKTFKKFKIKFHFLKIIPNILNKTGTDICPMEKLSLSKTPKEFYDSMREREK